MAAERRVITQRSPLGDTFLIRHVACKGSSRRGAIKKTSFKGADRIVAQPLNDPFRDARVGVSSVATD